MRVGYGDRPAASLVTKIRESHFTRRQVFAVTIANLTAFILLWTLVIRLGHIPSLIVPTPGAVAAALPKLQDEGVLVPNLMVSLRVYMIGLTISIIAAVPLGFLIGGVSILDRLVGPYVWILYTLPRIVLMPLILVWFGLGTGSRIILVIVSAVPAVMIFVMEGAKNTDVSLIRAGTAFGASRRRIITHVALPSTIPFVASGIRMGVSRALVGLFIGELFTGATGIGYLLILASRQFDTARVFFLLFLFIGFSLMMVSLSNVLERRATRWRTA